MIHSFAFVVLTWMVGLFPPAFGRWPRAYPVIAQAIVDACDGDVECMALLTAIGRHESDYNPNARGPAGEIGVWQLMPAHHPPSDIAGQAVVAWRLIRKSRIDCAANVEAEQLAGYTAGDCVRGRASSRRRWATAIALLGAGMSDR